MRRHALVLSVAACAATFTAAAAEQSFGKPLAGLPRTALADVLAAPEDGKVVRLEGTIEAVCQTKGCWLELKDGAAGIHVTFEGYSFFVPKDAKGRKVVAEGKVIVKAPSPEEVAHKQKEGATSAGSKVSFEASGVRITE